MADRTVVGILGATSLVGKSLLPLLVQNGFDVLAFSRQSHASTDHVDWIRIDEAAAWPRSVNPPPAEPVAFWISVVPIWVLTRYLQLLEVYGVQRIVALSSTSLFTKECSSDPSEQSVAKNLALGEGALTSWGEGHGVEWVILRPTLIYGYGRDQNVTQITNFVRRFGFFPILGKAQGLRQPVHADDVASACLNALFSSAAGNRAYNIAGGETLTYREMVCRVFNALERQPRLLSMPLGLFRFGVGLLRLLPHYRHWSVAMAERMNQDLVFDCDDAVRDLAYNPKPFNPAG